MEQRYRSRLPAALGDVSGPARGPVQLPLHVAWSDQTAFDLDRPRPRMHLYRSCSQRVNCAERPDVPEP